MPNVEVRLEIRGLGQVIAANYSRTEDGGEVREVTLAARPTGTLTTRTDNETGTITASSGGHGIITGQIIDVYWSTGARYGITVGTVSGTSIPIGADNAGTGDNLPAQSTALVISARTQIEVPIVASPSIVSMLLSYAATDVSPGHAEWFDSSDSAVDDVELEAGVPKLWDVAGGSDNPFNGGDSAYIQVSHGSSANAATFKLIVLQDTTIN